jgi:WD40 repeat protein
VYVSRLTDFGKVLPECGVLNGHKSPVLATSFSPFHTGLLATASNDCTVKVWNLDLYEDEASLEAPSDAPSKQKTNPYSKCLQAAGDTVQPVATFVSHRNSVRTCDFHCTVPNLLVTTALDATLRFHDVTEGTIALQQQRFNIAMQCNYTNMMPYDCSELHWIGLH